MGLLVQFISKKHRRTICTLIQCQNANFNLFPSTWNCLVWSSFHKAGSFTSFSSSAICSHPRSFKTDNSLWESLHITSGFNPILFQYPSFSSYQNDLLKWRHLRYMSNASITLNAENGIVKFCLDTVPSDENVTDKKGRKVLKRKKISRKAKLNELRFYRLKAKKKMKSSNPEVRIRYKLEKAKRKEVWLIEKLRKFEVPKPTAETYDPEILTEEDRFYLKRTGEKKKNYVPVGRRGVFGGVVLNMHLHWKRHETVKVVCKPCKPGQVHEYAEELGLLSKGIVIDIKANNTIIFYRGKNYVQPDIMSPPETLSKNKALEKYKYEQSLEHTSQFIEKLEKELEEYHEHLAKYRKGKESTQRNPMTNL